MKMSKDDETWSPEFWQASGILGLDSNGLNLTGTVDATYYRAGSKVPDRLSSTYSGNKETNIYIQETDSHLETNDNSEDNTGTQKMPQKETRASEEGELSGMVP